MKIEFPTRCEASETVMAYYAGQREPSQYFDAREKAWVTRADTTGLLCSLAKVATGERPDKSSSSRSSMFVREDGWHGTVNAAEAVMLAHLGWHEPVADVVSMARGVKVAQMTSLVPRIQNADEPGDLGIDMDRFLDGEDDYFLVSTQSEKERTGRGQVHLVLEPVCSAGTGEDAIVERGAVLAALIWALERAGVRVAVDYRTLVSTSAGEDVHVYAQVKKFGSRLDLRSLMFWLAHPAAGRRVMFEQVYRVKSAGAGFVGWSSKSSHRAGADPALPKHQIFCPALHINSLSSSEGWVSHVCKAAGVEFKKARR